MSCEVKCLSSVPDLPKVQEFLGFSQGEWLALKFAGNFCFHSNASFPDENWLNTVYLSISPTHELMVFAHGSKLIFLSKTSDGTNSSYTVSWSGEIQNPNEVVTSIICLPIFGYNVTSGAEWTSVAVGLSSGLVVFYTDSGIQIFSQRWAEEQVGFFSFCHMYSKELGNGMSLKFRSGSDVIRKLYSSEQYLPRTESKKKLSRTCCL